MSNFKIVFTATNAFDNVVATKTFFVQSEKFINLSNFLQKEHKAFNEACVRNIEERTWTNYKTFTCAENEVDIVLG